MFLLPWRRPPQASVRIATNGLALVLVLAACAVPFVAETVGLWRARAEVIAQSLRTTASVTTVAAKYVRGRVYLLKTPLAEIAERAERDGTGPEAIARLREVIAARTATAGAVQLIAVADSAGTTVAGSLPGAATLSIADREYFRAHRDSPDRAPRLGTPVISRVSGNWIVTYSRRLDNPDGSFAGVAFVAIDPRYFLRSFDLLDIGPGTAVGLTTTAGILVARRPDIAAPGSDLRDHPVVRAVAAGESSGSRAMLSTLDGTERLTSWREVAGLPLVVVTALDLDAVLAPWRRDAIATLGGTAIQSLVIFLLGAVLLRQSRARARATEALARSEHEYRLLAENSTDIIMHIGPEGLRDYISPACRELTQYEPEELIGRKVGGMVHPEDRPAWTASHAAADTGGLLQATYRTRRRDGTYVWVEARRRLLPGNQGTVVAVRDISARKAAEQALETAQAELLAANRELESLARRDGLTGLANRRHFDAALESELRRAAREATPLSLILIDIDFFKRFNDTYGHPAGDECLRLVAQVLTDHARRSHDVAARYGGEEMALILPDTTLNGAIELAWQLRGAIRGLAIPHAASPMNTVSVSIGVAEAVIDASPSAGPNLIAAADRHLYRAKEQGRDTVCHACPGICDCTEERRAVCPAPRSIAA